MNKISLLLQLVGIVLGIIAGATAKPEIINIAGIIANIFVQVLKWFSLPMIVFSILAATSKLEKHEEFLTLGKKIIGYTVATTLIAAAIGLMFFKIFNPTISNLEYIPVHGISEAGNSIFGLLLIGGVIFSLIISFIILKATTTSKTKIAIFFQKTYNLIMAIVRKILLLMPIAIFAFVTLFIHEINAVAIKNLGLYLSSIISANLTQAIIILPALLIIKKISVKQTFKGMFPALNVAFWSKSSGVALPVAIECARNNLQVKPKVANFALPLCITVNMNACAAFIITTVLFAATSYGINFSALELTAWVFIATAAAIGNAGVPMGCFTLACALVSYLGVPLYLLGIILPFYSMIDMLESAINVWSDSCITRVVDKEVA